MSQQTEIKELITKYHRRLHKLKEKEATLGINTPPEILIEIEDIEAKVEHLKEELKVSTPKPPLDTSNDTLGESQSNTFKQDGNSPVEVLIAKIGLRGTIITAILGLVGIGITAYFGYLGIQIQINAPIEATQTAETKLTESAFLVTPTKLTTSTVLPTDTSIPQLTHTSTPTPIPPDAPTSTGIATATPSNTPTSTDTATATSTKIPTSTNTATPSKTPTSSCPSPTFFQDEWKTYPQLGCPTDALTSDFTFQTFEGGILAWQKSPNPSTIYALFYNGRRWERQIDPGGPSQPSCPEAEQTGGLGPIFGFGTLWCELWKEQLGMPNDQEIDGENNQVQNFENGTILTIGEAGRFILYSNSQWEKF